jgi:hypothetical protein
MSKIRLYKKKFQNHFSRKTHESIMMRIVFSENQVVTISFFAEN